FIVQGSDGVDYLTRAGSFQQLSDGTLVNAAGFKLMGYEYSSTEDPTIVINGFDGLTEINLQAGGMNTTPSTAGYTTANLPANAAVGDTEKTSLIAYDSQGNSRKLDYTYTKTNDNEWELTVTYHDESVVPAVDVNMLPTSPLVLTFDANGKLDTPASGEFITNALTVSGADRKSTRLNSSHVKISYAVFCLEKRV